MRIELSRNPGFLGVSLLALAIATPAHAAEADAAEDASAETEIVVTGMPATYNNSATDEAMILQQPPVASALDLVDNLPGVQVQEGDAFGFDDWSTAVSVRGFQSNLDTQQVGITIDGLPNGGSGYGGGAKANRYIDTMNIGTIAVSQGTADIGSLSNEALGGTLDFVTSDPLEERRVRFSGAVGDFQAKRIYGRFDTGNVLGGVVRAWFSASYQEGSDWVAQSAQNNRQNYAMKFIVDTPVKLTGYVSFDDALENNYDQIYSADQYAAAPKTDGLTAQWYGVPYEDQAYRRAWATLRQNFFAYLKAETKIADTLDVKVAGYYHDMAGRGDWVPQYVVDVIADGAGKPQSELNGGHKDGGAILGQIFFVDANGVALTPRAGCVGHITFPYGGTSDPNYDPACYPAGAIGAQSYRHTHYRKDRTGGTADVAWNATFGEVDNRLRGGAWYEKTHRQEWRDWHNVTDTSVGPAYDSLAYWTQYRREYPQDTFKWYVEDQAIYGPVTVTVGAKQFINHIERIDAFGESENTRFKSTSKVLFSGGVQFEPVHGLNLFGGYAENFKALTDALLEYNNADISQLKPETAKNWEAGARYQTGWFNGSATWFKSKFSNQVIFVPNSTQAGNDYLSEGDGKFFNAGGIDAQGFELLAQARPLPGLNLYASYTYIDATYRGTGNDALDAEQGMHPGNRVTGIPKNMWVLSADYHTGPLRVGVSGKYTGKRFVNTSNTWQADNYLLTDAYIGLKGEAFSHLLKGIDVSLTVNNLTDKNYLGGISGNAAWIGAPRSAVLTVTADF
ncbi:TonB-dependent receptor [Novosphingobium album (ex Liu et al. 2023)]|uniref:TonB-dependent receptor n=1 Tax=Novosphingobium album (ex Liu et al. 2023) TaxID=3031130 RepID=A0ABT5WS83_9SPHN|nr:TonB-dependent receptor [Novosphingobium album (ex Liu et al. 2023)]MDE8652909.1 TonB-dependent receptor [Novosphingobium album (ex Liu et al. 2023)]